MLDSFIVHYRFVLIVSDPISFVVRVPVIPESMSRLYVHKWRRC